LNATNLAISGTSAHTGTSTFTGNIGVGTTPSNNLSYKLDVNGYVKSKAIAFHACAGVFRGTYLYPANTRITGIANQGWDSILTDSGSTGWNATTGVFTAQVAGYYMISASCWLNLVSMAFTIRKNATSSTTGTEYAGCSVINGAGVAAPDRAQNSAQAVVQMVINDTLSVWTASQGASITNSPATSISIYLIMPL
jgi:hypothetical protein